MDSLFSLISYTTIMNLPWIIKGPGLLVIGLFIYRFTKNIMQFRTASSAAALFWIAFTGAMLTRFGEDFSRIIFNLV